MTEHKSQLGGAPTRSGLVGFAQGSQHTQLSRAIENGLAASQAPSPRTLKSALEDKDALIARLHSTLAVAEKIGDELNGRLLPYANKEATEQGYSGPIDRAHVQNETANALVSEIDTALDRIRVSLGLPE